ncbi:SDR family NAD(P)-dependent oxidoreductase [Ectobacillus ponti]|uniref:SDR family oxidoreductase n=1 Tax=Ectobacillus ponti TaxID=2961894 RepID=A0AA41XC46_9BACI|nr:SDR family oxidoreductase [Ectobacillus ponti]MCP8970715.1 SDR family oxidoreductase [Ectobacillus ponti]
MDYTNLVVVVTGAANGIGKAIAGAYAEQGAVVIIADQDAQNGEQIAAALREKEKRAYFYEIDLQHVSAIREMFRAVGETYGPVRILVNNAGLSKFRPLLELTEAEWDEVLSVNLRSFVFAAQEFAKQNIGTSYGRIINIASTRALMSEPSSEAYAASKGGIVALTHALALSLQEEQITVNSISPGWIQTTDYEELRVQDHLQHPSRRVGKPEDIAAACLFLTDERNDFINGENIVIDGGMTKKMMYEE